VRWLRYWPGSCSSQDAAGAVSGGGAAGGKAAAVAIVPGGPHPYFEPMRQAIVDAAADFHHPRHA